LIRYVIHPEKFTGCGICLKACPHGAVSGERKKVHLIDDAACNRCVICREQCAFGAILIQ
jgi:NADH-quinone oxidoreductase subunit F